LGIRHFTGIWAALAMEEKHFSRVHLYAAAGDGDWFDERCV
jgi:hypothetical protein